METCFKCGKSMSREDGGAIIKGISIKIEFDTEKSPGSIEYNNLQLGKYSNGQGECDVGICYECYIDGLFQVPTLFLVK